MYSLTIEDSNGQIAEQFSFDHGSYLIGRQEGCDIVLPSASVSRRHAKIFVEDGRCYIEDLNSANGVTVDGQRVVKQRHLGTASQVRIGDYYLYLEYQGNDRLENQDVRQTLFISDSPDHNKLIRVDDEFAGEEFSLSEVENSIGRTDDNYILLSDPSISRQHAKIIREGQRYTLIDLGSSNGTRVNNDEVLEPTTLQPGDHVEFGNVQFVFVHGDEQIDPSDYATEESSPNKMLLGAGVAVLVLVGLATGGLIVFGFWSFKESSQTNQQAQTAENLDSEVSTILGEGNRQLERRKWDAAIESFNEVLALAPDNSRAKELREKARREKKAEELLEKGNQLSEDGEYQEAIEVLEKIPEDTVAASRAELTLDHVRKTVAYNLRESAESLMKEGGKDELRQAHGKLVQAVETAPSDEKAAELLGSLEERMEERGMDFDRKSDKL